MWSMQSWHEHSIITNFSVLIWSEGQIFSASLSVHIIALTEIVANTIKGLIRCYWEVYLILDCSNQSPVPGGRQVQCAFRPYLFGAEHDYWFLKNYYAPAMTPAVTTRYPITPFKSSYMWCIILVGCIWGGEVKLPTLAAWIQRL